MTVSYTPRDYQEAAVDSFFDYFEHHNGHPLAALPTGTGKSIVIAEFMRRAYTTYPGTRIMMVTHVRELIRQNLEKTVNVWPTAPVGVYSAGLNKRETFAPITFAGIQSVYNRASEFGEVHLLMVDEAHLIGSNASSQYRTFIAGLQEHNPKMRVLGLTATPYRLGHGMLTDPGGIFTDVCFDLTDRYSFNWLIEHGYLAPLVPKRTETSVAEQLSSVRVKGGEYVLKDLQHALDVDAITKAAIDEAIQLGASRKKWLVFTTGVEHTDNVTRELANRGLSAAAVHSRKTNAENDDSIAKFRAGDVQVLVSNNMLTTGFDVPDVDLIIVLRPTKSAALWVQMLGRGTRPAPGKVDCLVLDYAGNTQALGPINDPVLPRRRGKRGSGVAPVRLCDVCGCYSHASARTCENPACGTEFPRVVKISSTASMQELIATVTYPVETHTVDAVVYRQHNKAGRPPSMRVDYMCGLQRFSEYICLEHGGYAARVAQQWWDLRYADKLPTTTEEGLLYTAKLRTPSKIEVLMKPRYPEVVGYVFDH